jgi:hypothetical protein
MSEEIQLSCSAICITVMVLSAHGILPALLPVVPASTAVKYLQLTGLIGHELPGNGIVLVICAGCLYLIVGCLHFNLMTSYGSFAVLDALHGVCLYCKKRSEVESGPFPIKLNSSYSNSMLQLLCQEVVQHLDCNENLKSLYQAHFILV